MSSQQVQFLQRQVERKNAQIQVLLAECGMRVRVACAFAWDLNCTRAATYGMRDDVAYNATTDAIDCTEESAIERWEDALDAARAARTATEIALEEAGK